ncbi:MAG: iron-containing alcohol dehydrogenase [Clostridiales bacterium]|nr:iron-containing alcohol dehydrogenase [Clostridiales bacterium]
MMKNYYLPTNLLFGRGRISEIGTETAKWSKRALLVVGMGSAQKSGLLDRALGILKEAGVFCEIFSGVEPNPTTTTVYKGASIALEQNLGVIVGIGGGSVLDAAKAIAFSALNPGDLSDYIFGRKTSDLALPAILAPTTCGTGSEGNGFAVLTNPETGDKKSIKSHSIIAKASIIDPELMQTMPTRVLATVGFDALCHNMEAFLSKGSHPIAEGIALRGVELGASSLARACSGSKCSKAWDDLAWASVMGGMAINMAGVTAPHGLEHPASGLRNITHGEGLAALTPVIFDRSTGHGEDKFRVLANIIGRERNCASAVRRLLHDIDLLVKLSDLGVKEEDAEWMTDNALKISKAGLDAHPKAFSREEIKEIYLAAM